jgi:hypothetical protein
MPEFARRPVGLLLGGTLRRRHFITLLAGAWTCTGTFAAQKSPMARIGVLWTTRPPRLSLGTY